MRQYTKTDPNIRFDAKCMPVTESGCIIWMGCNDSRGDEDRIPYGRFSPMAGKTVMAHRFAYERVYGAVPEGKEIDHLCRIPLCVNPAHLEVVDRQENNRRSNSPSALNMRKLECKRGHPYTEESAYLHGGRRICRACRSVTKRAFYAKHRPKLLEDMKNYYARRGAR